MSDVQEKIAETLRKKAELNLRDDLRKQTLGAVHPRAMINAKDRERIKQYMERNDFSTDDLRIIINDVLFNAMIEQYEQKEVLKFFKEVGEIKQRLATLEDEAGSV